MRPVIIKRVLGTKPIQSDWIIFNAPRPLYGTQTWQGDFAHGIFYAAVDPVGDPYAHDWIKRNAELDGWLLEYVTEEDIAKWGRQHLIDQGVNPDDYDQSDYIYAYWHLRGRSETTLEELLMLCAVGIEVPGEKK